MEWTWRARGVKLVRKIVTRQRSCAESTGRIKLDPHHQRTHAKSHEGDYHYPYAIFVSKFLLYFKVNLEDETYELVKSTQELNNGSLSKMGFTKVGGKWISMDGDHGASSSGAANLEQDEPADMDVQHEDPPEDYEDAGPSAGAGNQGERMQTMFSFERLMVNRLDSFDENQRSLHDLCVSNFQRIDTRFDNMDARFMTLDEQIEAVQNQIFDLQFADEEE